jgi:hypothetical protein
MKCTQEPSVTFVERAKCKTRNIANVRNGYFVIQPIADKADPAGRVVQLPRKTGKI